MKIKLHSTQVIALFFLSVALIGSILLFLPFSTIERLSYIDSLFIATSATCVTGLSTVNVGVTFTIFGKIIIAILIQIGGLGYAALATLSLSLLRQRASIKKLDVIKTSMSIDNLTDIRSLLKFVILFTFISETFGFLLSYLALIKNYGFIDSIGYAAFHSISSFNNAGFDIFGTTDSLIILSNNVELLVITMILIVTGGLGFFVHRDIGSKKNFKEFTLHSKIVIIMTIGLIIVGTILIKLSGLSFLDSLFQSITTRTAGFSTVNIGSLPSWTLSIMLVFMIIGASPGSTGGGIKTTTAFIIISSIFTMGSDTPIVAFKRKLRKKEAMTAFQIFFLAIFLLFVSALLLQLSNPHLNLKAIIFECVSAFATVGLSTGITSSLNSIGKIVIITLMYVGRIGPLTLILSVLSKNDEKSKGNLGYIEETVFI